MDIPTNINKEQLKTIRLDKPDYSFHFFIEGFSDISKTIMIELNNDKNSYISLLPIEIINNVLFQHFYEYHILSKNPHILKKELDTIRIILIVSKNCNIVFRKFSFKYLLEQSRLFYYAYQLNINTNGHGYIHLKIPGKDLLYNIKEIDIYEINYIKND